MKKIFTFCLLLILSVFSSVKANDNPPRHLWTAKNPFEQKVFIENLGQYVLKNKAEAKDILFGARQEGMQYFFTKDGLWIKRIEKMERTKREMERFKKQIGEKEEEDRDGEEKEDNLVKYKFVDRYYRMEFEGAGIGTTFETEGKVSQYFAFHTDQNKNVEAHGYKKITYKNLYPNIDMEFYFPEDKQGFKYNLILHPGADLSLVKINYPNNEGITLNSQGNIVIKSIFGDFTDHAPIANEPKTNKSIPCFFSLKKNTASFFMPAYDKNKGAVIDPWTTTPVFAGGNAAYDVDWDLAGNCYAYGGTSPYQLVKFSPAGVQLWTYTNTFSSTGGGSYYGDFAVNRLSGSAFVIDGFNSSGAGCEKVNLAGGFAVAGVSNSSFQEMWRIVYSRCTNQVVIAGGGTTSPSYTGATFDTSLTGINIANVINSPTGLHDMWGVAIDAFGSAYFATAQTQVGSAGYDNYIFKVPTPALTPITYSVATTYSFVEVASVTYPGFSFSSPNGFNGMAMSNRNLYTYDSYSLNKWNSVTGAMTGSANINGPSQNTVSCGGLAVDECDHLFLGLNNSIKQYDGVSMSQTGTIAAAGTVYDVSLGTNNILYSCGNGFVTATAVNLPNCTILQPTLTVTNASCSNPVGSATIAISGGTAPYNITWSTAPVQTGTTVTNLSAGNYTANITDNSCPPLTATYTFAITQTNGVAVTPVITNVKCKGGNNGALSITNTGTVAATYTWSTGSNASSISNLTAGNYSVVISSNTGCNMTLGLTVTEPPALSYTLTPGTLKCYGDTTSINLAVSGGTPAKLTPNYVINWNPPAATGLAVHGLVAGNYGATITDSLGCSTNFTVALTQPAQITPDFTFTPACFGSPIKFSDLSNGGPFSSWSWNYGDGSALGTTQNPSYTYAATGNYTVALTTTTLAGCSATVTHSLSVYPAPTAFLVEIVLQAAPRLQPSLPINQLPYLDK